MVMNGFRKSLSGVRRAVAGVVVTLLVAAGVVAAAPAAQAQRQLSSCPGTGPNTCGAGDHRHHGRGLTGRRRSRRAHRRPTA